MRIWIDLANSPHVPFFRSLANDFMRRNHDVVVTARAFAETVELAEAAGFAPQVIGGHGGGKLSGKAGNLVQRALALARWARGRNIDLALSHNSYSQILAARALSLKAVTLMDYEHQPANHLAFRLASRVIVPRAFPAKELRKYGASTRKVRRYDGTKEDTYLADFTPDPRFPEALRKLGVASEEVLVVARPPAREALYHRFENELFDELIFHLSSRPDVKIILLPRSDAQRAAYESRKFSNVIMPREALDGANLIAAADFVASAGGTMNREAATLGVPAASVYAGKWAAIDEELVREGRLQRLAAREDIDSLSIAKKKSIDPRNARDARAEVVALILE